MTVLENPVGQVPPRVLVDRLADEALDRRGYAIVPFLDADECERLRRSHTVPAEGDDGLVIDFTLADRSVMQATSDLLAPVWDEHLDRLFLHHRVVVATFIVKHPGPSSRMVMHHEPTFADPAVRTFNAWIPLVDVGPSRANGALRLVLGTEHLPHGLVGFNTPPVFRQYEEVFEQASIAVEVPAGSALVYDTRMLHWSEANASDEPRPAIAAAFAPREAPLLHVVATGRRGRSLYEVDDDFFVDLHPAEVAAMLPTSRAPLRQVEEVSDISPDDVREALGLTAAVVRRTCLPTDLCDAGPPPTELDSEQVADAHLPAHDVPYGPADVPSGAGPGGYSFPVFASAAAVALDRLPDALDARFCAGLRSLAPTETWDRAFVLAVDPGGRVEARPDSDHPVVVCTYEAPQVRAGLRTADGVGSLDPGRSLRIPGGSPWRLWNDGPGPAWVVVSPASRLGPPTAVEPDRPSRGVRGRLRRFRRR